MITLGSTTVHALSIGAMMEKNGQSIHVDEIDDKDLPPPGNTILNPYSCLPCRKKKKKCDRIYPCQNCQRAGAECAFASRRPSSRKVVPLGAMERLRRLEDAIGTLRSELKLESSPAVPQGTVPIETSSYGKFNDSALSRRWSCADEMSHLETEVGRLAVGEGRSRYVVSSYWASLDEEVSNCISIRLRYCLC